MAALPRRTSVPVKIGDVWVGGDHPIVVQSMTNTDTADTASTVNQVMALAQAGSELVRVTVNTEAAAQAVPKIVDTLDKFGVRVPIIGDFHYNGHILLKKYPDMRARAGQVPHQSRQRQHRQEARRQFPHHDRSRHRIRSPGAHRRQLGLARSGAAHAHDGRKLAPARAAGRDGSHAGRHRRQRRSNPPQAAERYGLGARQDHPQRQGQRRAGSHRRLPHAGRRSAITRCTSA